MGNPSIPHLFNQVADSTALAEESLTWRVFELRRRGVKLDRVQALATERCGVIHIQAAGSLHAYLNDSRGNQLMRLDQVRLRRLTPRGEMLLHGLEMFQTSREISEWPQAWWCVVVARNA